MADATNTGESPRVKWDSVSNWSIVGLLATLGPLVLSELRSREDKQETLWKEAQARTELVVRDQTQAYQKSIQELVEQWKEDRRMLIDVLKDGRLDGPVTGERPDRSEHKADSAEHVHLAVEQWKSEIEKVH